VPDEDSSQDVTEFLARIEQGDDSATEKLLTLLYKELRALAGKYFLLQDSDHTLQPTALVHEAFIKIAGSSGTGWKSRAHFLAVAAKAMRQILINHAKAKKTSKRGVGRRRVTLSGLATPTHRDIDIDLDDLTEALEELAELSPRQVRIVEMRFLAGLGDSEIAQVLDLSTRTVRREWRMARAFLKSELIGDSSS
jgi:RNA polymerase sigma factor (TIGR02999 family)